MELHNTMKKEGFKESEIILALNQQEHYFNSLEEQKELNKRVKGLQALKK